MLEAASWELQPTSPFELRHASTERPFFVNVPARRFLVIEGAGPRGADDYAAATVILREVDHVLLTRLRHDAFSPPTHPILEVIWTIPQGLGRDELSELLESGTGLHWAQLLEIPDVAGDEVAREAIDHVRSAAGRSMALVRAVELREGPAVQLLRIGEQERIPSILRLFEIVGAMGLHDAGRIHELLLTDATYVSAQRSRAIVRLPIAH